MSHRWLPKLSYRLSADRLDADRTFDPYADTTSCHLIHLTLLDVVQNRALRKSPDAFPIDISEPTLLSWRNFEP